MAAEGPALMPASGRNEGRGMTGQGPATLAMVAAEADVSIATASRVLNGERKVGEPHRSRSGSATGRTPWPRPPQEEPATSWG